jgi:hypothetical protein
VGIQNTLWVALGVLDITIHRSISKERDVRFCHVHGDIIFSLLTHDEIQKRASNSTKNNPG